MNSSSGADKHKVFPVVGRDSQVELTKYTTRVLGRDVIDYDKLKAEDPKLYAEILHNEHEADKRSQEELDEILAMPATPYESILSFVSIEKPATGKYFYAPVFASNPRLSPIDGKKEADVLAYIDDAGNPMEYASRVLPGQTLAEAIKKDLHEDFQYDGQFEIKGYHFYNMAPDKHGTPLPRYVVMIKVDRFPTDTLRPTNLHTEWNSNGANLLLDYNFQIN